MDSCIQEVQVSEVEIALKARINDLEFRLLAVTRALETLLPIDTLALIFRRAIPPHDLLDRGLCAGPDSPWCRTVELKKCLTLVCQAWRVTALQLLYEDVCIRRIHQAFKLLETLKGSSGTLIGSLIGSLEIGCYIPIGEDEDEWPLPAEVDDCLRETMTLCPRLMRFSYASPCALPPGVISNRGFLKPSIIHLALNNSVHPEAFGALVGAVSNHLQWIRVGIPPAVVTGDADLQSRFSFDFPLLGTLIVESEGLRCSATELYIVRNRWEMPGLKQLVIMDCCDTIPLVFSSRRQMPQNYAAFVRAIGALLSKIGRNLRHLCINTEWWYTELASTLKDPEYPNDWQAVFDSCPHLTRLTIDPHVFKYQLQHQSLQWIDLIHNRSANSDLNISNPQLFPSLLGVRRIYSLPQYTLEWITQFNPLSVDEMQDLFAIDMFHHRLVYHHGSIYFRIDTSEPRPDPYVEECEDEEDEENDSGTGVTDTDDTSSENERDAEEPQS